MDEFLFFDCVSTFYFLFVEFHFTFSISDMVITNVVYYYCIFPPKGQWMDYNYCCRLGSLGSYCRPEL